MKANLLLTVLPESRKVAAILALWLAPLLILACTAITASAQQPFQDAKGGGSIFINGGGYVQVNVADPSVKIGYLHEVNPSQWSFGVTASGKLTGTRASLFTNNRTVPDSQISVSIGRKYVLAHRFDLSDPADERRLEEARDAAVKAGLKPNADLGDYLTDLPFDRLSLQIGFAHKQYKLFDPASNVDKQVSKKNFYSPFASLSYFVQLKQGNLLGAAFGVERTNNTNDLTEVEVRDINAATNSGVTREVARIQKALRGNYKETTGTFLNTDYVWFPSPLEKRIGVSFFTRNGLSGADKGFRPGLGIFLSEKGAPTRVIGGASVTLVNGKASISLIAGYNF